MATSTKNARPAAAENDPCYELKYRAGSSDGVRLDDDKYPGNHRPVGDNHEKNREWLFKLANMFRDQVGLDKSTPNIAARRTIRTNSIQTGSISSRAFRSTTTYDAKRLTHQKANRATQRAPITSCTVIREGPSRSLLDRQTSSFLTYYGSPRAARIRLYVRVFYVILKTQRLPLSHPHHFSLVRQSTLTLLLPPFLLLLLLLLPLPLPSLSLSLPLSLPLPLLLLSRQQQSGLLNRHLLGFSHRQVDRSSSGRAR